MADLSHSIRRILPIAAGALLCHTATLLGAVILEKKPSPPELSASIHALALPLPDRLWIAGEGLLVLLSGELGQAWWGPTAPLDFWLLDIVFGDRDHGWAVGTSGTVLRTDDGGGTWEENGPKTASNFHTAWASGPSELWVGGSDGVILHTADGGETWETRRESHDGVVRRLFFNADSGWAVGDHGMVLHTADRGVTWTRLGEDSVPTRVNLYGIAFLDDRYGHAWGDSGKLLSTTDGGRRWQGLDLGTSQTIRDLLFPTSGPRIALATGAMLAVEGLAAFGTDTEVRVRDRSWTGGAIHRGLATPHVGALAIGDRGLVARVWWAPGEAGIAGGLRIDRVLGQFPEPGALPAARARGVVEAARAFLGKAYQLDPLGEGPDGKVDRDPRFSNDGFDCVTLIEQAMALELSGGGDRLLPELDRIRYRAGRVDFHTRNHFFVADWIPQNSWLVEDVTTTVGGSASRLITRRIDRRRVFHARGIDATELPNEKRSTWVIPIPELAALADRLEDGNIAVMVGNRRWLFALHAGILVRRPEADSRLFMRHASGAVGKVIDEDFFSYMERDSPRLVGVKILRLVE